MDFGAIGDGFTDDTVAFQNALNSGAANVIVPFGRYKISQTLLLPSNTTILADQCARIILSPTQTLKRGEFLLSNADVTGGNVNVAICGGIWDGNNRAPECAKPDLFDKTGYSGAVLNFVNVDGLTLKNVTVANSTTFYVRMSRIHNFTIENIDLLSDVYGKNQDGLHFGGDCRHGVVKNVRALSFGQTNDDMIALNADDSIERVENLDLVRDGIEDITFENIFAENCYTVIRMLSVTAPIKNIRFRNIYAGYRYYVINADGARYCRTPLFDECDFPVGVGACENIELENVVCYPVNNQTANYNGERYNSQYALRLESNFHHFNVRNFKKIRVKGDEDTVALLVKNVKNARITADETTIALCEKDEQCTVKDFTNLCIERF